MNQIIIGLLLVFIPSIGTTQHLHGTYRSNFASAGFFITEITFRNDSSFKYTFSGDVMHKVLTGNYLIRESDVYLHFDEGDRPIIKIDIDSLEAKTLGLPTGTRIYEFANANYHNCELKEEGGIQFHQKYKLESGRLYGYRVDNGQLVRTDKFYNGKTWVSKECYLEKVN